MNKIKTYFSLAALIFSTVIVVAYFEQIAQALSILLTVLIGVLAVGSVMFLIVTALFVYERLRMVRAKRIGMEKEAHVLVVSENGLLFVRDTGKAYWHNLTTEMRTYSNGKASTPTILEQQAWMIAHSPKVIDSQAGQAPMLLPGTKQLPDHVQLDQYAGNPTLRSLFLGVGLLNGSIQPISYPISRLVNVAIAGAPGFGKSTLMQSIAWQILNSREGVKAVLLDAANVTFTPFVGDGNLLYPLASSPADIAGILAELVEEMEKRNELFSRWRGIANLEKYNSVAEEKLPVIPILFDEFGFVSGDRRIDEAITLLGRGGRKTGIYLLVGSQTWHAKDLNSAFRATCLTTIQFKTRDKSTSRVLLGSSEAVNINRVGEARVILPGVSAVIPMQAPDPANVIDVTPQLIDGDDWLAASRQIPELREKPEMTTPAIDPARVLELFDSGECKTPTAICTKMFGYKNGKVLEQIKSILIENERIG